MSDIGTVHIIAQTYWHTPAFIVGTAAGLTALRDALDAAIRAPENTQSVKLFADDGEGYRVHVRCETGPGMDSVPYGYTDEIARSDMPWPDWMRESP